MIEGYKFFNEGFKSNYKNMQYEVGKTYTYNGEIKLCKSGFHFSKKLEDAFNYYYCFSAKHCCKVIGSGKIIEGDDKIVCSEIYIKEELDFNDMLRKLSENEDYVVRLNVVRNKNCSIEILIKLFKEKDYLIKENIMYNRNCPKDI